MLKGEYRREILVCEDGGTSALDWWVSNKHNLVLATDAPVVLILHGVGGDSMEAYCKWMCETAASEGWRPVVLTLRRASPPIPIQMQPLPIARHSNIGNAMDTAVLIIDAAIITVI